MSWTEDRRSRLWDWLVSRDDCPDGLFRPRESSMSVLQEVQHDGDYSTAESGAPASEGLYPYSDRVKLVKSGWVDPVAEGFCSGEGTHIDLDAGITCQIYIIRRVRLSQPAGLLWLQGATPAFLFDGCSFVYASDATKSVFDPMMLALLDPEGVNQFKPPLTVKKLILARVQFSESVSVPELEKVRHRVFMHALALTVAENQ